MLIVGIGDGLTTWSTARKWGSGGSAPKHSPQRARYTAKALLWILASRESFQLQLWSPLTHCPQTFASRVAGACSSMAAHGQPRAAPGQQTPGPRVPRHPAVLGGQQPRAAALRHFSSTGFKGSEIADSYHSPSPSCRAKTELKLQV